MKAFLRQVYPSKRLLKKIKFSALITKFIDRMITYLSFQHQSVNMMSYVNKYKTSLEPAKHINERVRKLLQKAIGARESNMENRTRRSKIKSIGIIVSRNYPITGYYKFLHGKNNQSDKDYNFLHGKRNQSNHYHRSLHVSHPRNDGLIACLATNQIQVLFAQHVIRTIIKSLW